MGLEAAPLTLDPRLAIDAYSTKLCRLLHRGLFRLNSRLEPIPDLVESYEFKAPLTYHFTLKKALTFQDGSPLTAADVKATLESVVDPALASPYRSALEKIASIEVTGDDQLDITLKEPLASLLANLTLGIIPENNPKIGAGPYQLQEFKPNDRVVLVRNPHYSTAARLDTLIFRIIPDDNLRVLELMNGKIDLLLNNVPPLLVEPLSHRANLQVQTTQGINVNYLGLNLQEEHLQKLVVRQALALALNIPELIQYRMAGLAHTAKGWLAPMHWAYEPEVKGYAYDPNEARRLLDQAGYPDPDGAGPLPRFTLTFKTSTKKDRIGLARLYARYWKDVGVEVKILPFEWATLFHDIQLGKFQIFSLTWVGLTEPDLPPLGANRGHYANPVMDQLTAEGRREMDTGKRKEIYSYVQKIMGDDLPSIPLWYEDNVAVQQKNVKGLQLRPDGSFEALTEVYKE